MCRAPRTWGSRPLASSLYAHALAASFLRSVHLILWPRTSPPLGCLSRARFCVLLPPPPQGVTPAPSTSASDAAVHTAERRALDLADKLAAVEKQLAKEQKERREEVEKLEAEARAAARASTDEVRLPPGAALSPTCTGSVATSSGARALFAASGDSEAVAPEICLPPNCQGLPFTYTRTCSPAACAHAPRLLVFVTRKQTPSRRCRRRSARWLGRLPGQTPWPGS